MVEMPSVIIVYKSVKVALSMFYKILKDIEFVACANPSHR